MRCEEKTLWMRKLVPLLNEYAALAEGQCQILFPEFATRQHRLMSLIPEAWLLKGTGGDDLPEGTRFRSKFFTSMYCSNDGRASSLHTDYRNSHVVGM
jgi:hypothetical protein